MEQSKKPIDLNSYYQYDFSKMKINVVNQTYSNLAWITVSGRDVFIDFMAMPGVLVDGIPVINATRVFMSPPAAAKLAEALMKTVDEANSNKGFETVEKTEHEQQ
jgi:hypothetical protein